MPIPSISKKSEDLPNYLLGKWLRLHFNSTNIYLVKQINGSCLAFSLTTGNPSYTPIDNTDIIGIYEPPVLPEVPQLYTTHPKLKPGDIARDADKTNEWYLVAEYCKSLYRLYISTPGVAKITPAQQDFFVLDKCNLGFRKVTWSD